MWHKGAVRGCSYVSRLESTHLHEHCTYKPPHTDHIVRTNLHTQTTLYVQTSTHRPHCTYIPPHTGHIVRTNLHTQGTLYVQTSTHRPHCTYIPPHTGHIVRTNLHIQTTLYIQTSTHRPHTLKAAALGFSGIDWWIV